MLKLSDTWRVGPYILSVGAWLIPMHLTRQHSVTNGELLGSILQL